MLLICQKLFLGKSLSNFLLDKKDHPDNLYLSCQRCNASLSDNFPDTELRNEIETRGTIGDWLRGHVESIREQ